MHGSCQAERHCTPVCAQSDRRDVLGSSQAGWQCNPVCARQKDIYEDNQGDEINGKANNRTK